MTYTKSRPDTDGYDLIAEVLKKWWHQMCYLNGTYIVKFRNWYDHEEEPSCWQYCYIDAIQTNKGDDIAFEWDFDEGQENYEIAGFVSLDTLCKNNDTWFLPRRIKK